jgi:transcriptional regulator with XRE-family HTH domain
LLKMRELYVFYICYSANSLTPLMSSSNYNRIKELLAKKGKKNVELAKFMDVDPRTVSSWCGNNSQPEYATLFKISDFLEVEAGELLTLKRDLRNVDRKGNAVKTLTKKKNKGKR